MKVASTSTATEQAAAPAGGEARRPRRWLPWAATGVAALAAFVALTWPLALHFDHFWTMTGNGSREEPFVRRPGAMTGGDQLQTVFIQSVVVDNARELRNPYVDLREGAAGPRPLRTTSLDVPWTPLVGLLWLLVGLVPAYNATLLLSSLATALLAFGWLRRHTRWPLLAAALALAYAFTPHRMFQLTGHFNAVMTWAFPATLWAFEVAVERYQARRRWWPQALALAAVVLTVAASGEYHLILYLEGLLAYLVLWSLLAPLARRLRGREEPGRVPLGPLLVTGGAMLAAAGYVLAVFSYAFRGTVAGDNGAYEQVELYAPGNLAALVSKAFGTHGEELLYVGWPMVLLAAVGAVVVARGYRPGARYALLLVPMLLLTYGPALDVGPLRPYRFLFDHVPFLSLQRVTGRAMALTALLIAFLVLCALDWTGTRLRASAPGRRRLAAAVLVLATAALLADYRISRSSLEPDRTGNRVVRALATGDGAPLLGIPALPPWNTWNSVTTYLAAQSRRRTLNAYNQTPAPWLEERMAVLEPLNDGVVTGQALAVLDAAGTTEVVVVDEPHVFEAGEWRATIDRLVASGEFRLVVRDGPLALLERTG